MRLVVFCLAVLSWNSAVVHVVAVPVTMSCPEKLEHGASAVVTCEINTVEVASAKCFANPTTVTFVQTSAGKTSTCPTSYTTTNCTASNADANGTCACTGLAGDIKTFTFRFVADKDQHNGAEFECSVCSASPPMEIQQNNCKSLTFDVNLHIVATTHCPDTFVEGGPNLVNCTIYGDRVTCSPTPKKIPIILTQNGNPGVSAGPDYPPTCNPDVGVIPNGEAKCTKKDDNTYTYVYKFMGANKTHKRDTLQCTVPCFGVTPDIGNACEITFEEPTEVGSGTTDTNCNNRGTNSTSSDGKGSSSSNLGLIIGATAGGVVVVAMAIGISIYCYKKRSSGVTTPPPIVGPASHPADRGVAATLDVKPTEEEAGEKDSEASEATDVSETSEEP